MTFGILARRYSGGFVPELGYGPAANVESTCSLIRLKGLKSLYFKVRAHLRDAELAVLLVHAEHFTRPVQPGLSMCVCACVCKHAYFVQQGESGLQRIIYRCDEASRIQVSLKI